MKDTGIRNIVIIGSGKLARNLSVSIRKSGYEIREVCNRSETAGKILSAMTGAKFINQPEAITPLADMYIIAVADSGISSVIGRMPRVKGLVIHNAGSTDISVLSGKFESYGVLYPVQTFTQKVRPMRGIPVCIEGNTDLTVEKIESVASSIGCIPYRYSSEKRRVVHLAAVFANNFTNFILSASRDIISDEEIDHHILDAIVRRTAGNYFTSDVFGKQTGPAMRNDQEIIKKHLEMLNSLPEYQELYSVITRNILRRKKKYDQL